jgi:starvation-inducible DNA-binding protein
MELKLHGARRLTIRAWEALKQSRGSVVFMSGSAALDPKPGFAAGASTNVAMSRYGQPEEIAEPLGYMGCPVPRCEWTAARSKGSRLKHGTSSRRYVVCTPRGPEESMATTSTTHSGNDQRLREAQPIMRQRSRETQPFGTLARYPLSLGDDARAASVEALNQVLCDTIVLRDMYKKHHWQASGPTFYAIHLLFDKHASEQAELIDLLAERVQTLGGVAIAMAHDVAEMTRVERVPRGREELPVQLSRLLEAHEVVLKETRAAAKRATEMGDDGTNDIFVSEVIRTNELQVWFVAEHLVDTPLVRAK